MRENYCVLCEQPFEIGRIDKRYCSANCRSKASKSRIKKQEKKQVFLTKNKELVGLFKNEFDVFKDSLLSSDPVIQKERIIQYWKGAIQMSEAVGSITNWKALVEFYEILEIPLGYQLTEVEYNQITGKKKGIIAKSIDYARLTFVLSFIGFLGSIGFYFGVLREVYSPVRDKQKIEVLKAQNAELENTVNILVEQEAEE